MIYSKITKAILSPIDVEIGGNRPWDIQVRDPRFYRRVLLEGALGLGESYMEGMWDCADLEELVYRFIRGGVERVVQLLPNVVGLNLVANVLNRQTKTKSLRVAREHYDLDNDLFFNFLGKYHNYSCAYYRDTEDLDVAQLQKMNLICDKLGLTATDRVLDVGGGWGEIARHMATRHGCKVTSINISEEQMRYSREHCRGTSVDIVRRDYRDLDGEYDKIAVIAMLSHVGYKNYRTMFETLHRHLVPDGIVLVETVGANVSLAHCNPWLDRYIFPGAQFPSIKQIAEAVEGLFVIEDIHNFGPSYTKTLRAWNANFQRNWPTLAKRYDERTRRMFEFFFLTVAAFFRARDHQNWHLVLSRQGAPMPACRVS